MHRNFAAFPILKPPSIGRSTGSNPAIPVIYSSPVPIIGASRGTDLSRSTNRRALSLANPTSNRRRQQILGSPGWRSLSSRVTPSPRKSPASSGAPGNSPRGGRTPETTATSSGSVTSPSKRSQRATSPLRKSPNGVAGPRAIDLAVAGVVVLDGFAQAIGAGRRNDLAGEAPVGIERLVVDRHRPRRGVRRRGRLHPIAVRVDREGHRRRRARRSAGRRIGRLAVDRRAIAKSLRDIIGRQIDRGDARLRQGFHGGGPIGVGDHQLEIGKIRVARVQGAVVVGVERVLQRLHVVRRGWIPIREHHLIGLGNLIGVVWIVKQHRVPRPGPGRQVQLAVSVHVEKCVRRRQRRDLYSLAREVENDGTGDGGAGRRRRRRRRRIVRLYLNFVGAGGRGGIIGDQSSRQAPRTRRRGQGRRDVQIWHRRELLVKPVSRIGKNFVRGAC